jgi:hypothetical protein
MNTDLKHQENNSVYISAYIIYTYSHADYKDTKRYVGKTGLSLGVDM